MGPGRARRRRIRRFVVEGESMLPHFRPGDLVLGLATERARPGQCRVFRHPHRPRMWLVKRVAEVHPEATMTVLSDNAAATLADSRTFGAVPIAGSYRVVGRLPARFGPRPQNP